MDAKSRAGLDVADWDDDGDLDLLVSVADGSVSLYRNTGSAQKPKLALRTQLVPPGEETYGSDAPTEARRGGRAKICVADWNGDGRLDLLVGDYRLKQLNKSRPRQYERHGWVWLFLRKP